MHKILTDEEISKRAYKIYLKHGGDAVDNWFHARNEMEREAEIAEAKEAAEIEEVGRQRHRREELWPEKPGVERVVRQ